MLDAGTQVKMRYLHTEVRSLGVDLSGSCWWIRGKNSLEFGLDAEFLGVPFIWNRIVGLDFGFGLLKPNRDPQIFVFMPSVSGFFLNKRGNVEQHFLVYFGMMLTTENYLNGFVNGENLLRNIGLIK